MLNKYRPFALAALLGVGAFAVSVGGASAAAIPAVKQIAAGDVINGGNSLLVEVAWCGNGRPCWNRHRHGHRYRYRYGRYHYYYGGYYYNNPWWLVSVPIVIGGSSYRGGNRHVQWCYDHYRSYNPRTNTWVSYSGNVNQCISPYRY